MQKEIKLSLSEFKSKVDRIKNSQFSNEAPFTVSPHFEFENIELEGNLLVIEKTLKPIYSGSPYHGVMGTIRSEVVETNDGIKLKPHYSNLNIAGLKFMTYFGSFFIIMIFTCLLLFDFNIYYIPALLLTELFFLFFIKLSKNSSIEELEKYHNELIDYIVSFKSN